MRNVRLFIRDGFKGAEAASCSVLQIFNSCGVAARLAVAQIVIERVDLEVYLRIR